MGSASLVGSRAFAERAIPDDNLAYPVMVTLRSSNGKASLGSGFYINRPNGIYFVTAKHVIFTQNGPEAQLELMSYSRYFSTHQPIILTASLSELNAAGNLRAHEHKDVAVVKVATVEDNPSEVTPKNQPPSPSTSPAPQTPTTVVPITFVAGITMTAAPGTVIVSFGPEAVRTYEQVLVGNDAIVYGYPRSLGGLSPDKQFDLDPARPLLRKGLVAGLNDAKRTIILDCPAYPGNSGGPAVEIEPEGFQRKYLIIGVVVEFVPWVAENFAFNSGYSVVEPMDGVLELTK
jgi:Trypsin-like peptidase domain